GERIRTSDILLPKQALYQAEPRPGPAAPRFLADCRPADNGGRQACQIGSGLLGGVRPGQIQVEAAAAHQIGARQAVALQQLEDAAEQFAAMERRSDELVAIPRAPPRPTGKLAGQ